MKNVWIACALAGLLAACASSSNRPPAAPVVAKKKVILFVWDGLRPDSVTAALTPNLAALRDREGVNFTDNHAAYPTFTMMNASAFATGAYPGTHGFYGNTLYQPGPSGPDSAGQALDFSHPMFTEDYGVLAALNSYYGNKLYLVGSLFQAAQAAGLRTAVVGKSGAAFIQDYADYAADHRDGTGRGVLLDEKFAFPLAFAKELQAAGIHLPKLSPVNYGGALALAADNGDPTAFDNGALVSLADHMTKDPRAGKGSPYSSANAYMMGVYLDHILPKDDPDLTLIWFRNPDSTEHAFGPGTPAYAAALASQDELLGRLMDRLKALGLQDRTDLIVVSDHGHTTVAGDPLLFPLRALNGPSDGKATVGAPDPKGFSVSGDTRTADLLTRAGIAHVYDGAGCLYDPVLSGIAADGAKVYPDQTDADGSVCGKPGQKFSTRSYAIPSVLPADAAVIAANGGSDYLYLPDHDATRVAAIVKALQSRPQYGAIFVAGRYGSVPGTLPLTLVRIEGAGTGMRNPDIVVSFDDDADAITGANPDVPGTEYESFANNRGMHGTFGVRDVRNSLFASGPDFVAGYADTCPSSNVDVAPTVAAILGLALPQADGRPLLEAMKGSGKSCAAGDFSVQTIASSAVGGLTVLYPTDPDGKSVDASRSKYRFTLTTKVLRAPDGRTYTYFDKAKAVRE